MYQRSAVFRRCSSGPVGLQMTAMIDVIFLLLTFLVLTARFRTSGQVVPMQKPKLASDVKAAAGSVEPLRIEVRSLADGGCTVNLGPGRQIRLNRTDIEKGLSGLSAAIGQPLDVPVELHCDRKVQWDWVVKVYDAVFTAGADDITFVIEEK